ncbi:Heat shock 70 kDa protein 1-like [Blyttiomyces sp. JEL0837]|nr:Heat shock 70 kDa protein 1-like [Blyttiomyces sp. JEL0837]
MWESEPVYIGIGFGTLNSTIAIVGKDGSGETIANEDGDRYIPSYVAFTGYEELVGSQAKVQAMSNQKGTIVEFRNLLGLKFNDDEVQHHSEQLAMSIVPYPQDSTLPSYEIEVYENEEAEESQTQHVTVSEVTTKYLRKLKETAEGYLGKTVTGSVISVPAHFAEKSQEALIRAAEDAGFSKVFPIKEPVAAALAFDNAVSMSYSTAGGKADRLILVVDLGGHQFNVTLLSANNGLFSVISSLDDYKLGGVHFDEVLVKYVMDDFKRKSKLDMSKNRRSLLKLRSACEQTKRMLSQKDTAPCSVDSLFEGIDYHGQILRNRFENMAEPLFQRCGELVNRAMKESRISASMVDEVLFVGGASRIPRFQNVIKSIFPESTKIRTDVEPDEAIGAGAAKQAAIIVNAESEGLDFAKASVAKELTELPHLNHSVGIEGADGSFVVIIPRLAPIPARRSVEFSNSVKNQKEVYLAVYEGQDPVAKKNNLLAEIVLQDLPDNLGVGEGKIDVVFLIERDEILSVTAKERTTGKQNKIPAPPFEPKLLEPTFAPDRLYRDAVGSIHAITPLKLLSKDNDTVAPLQQGLLWKPETQGSAQLDPADQILLAPYEEPKIAPVPQRPRPSTSWLKRTDFGLDSPRPGPQKVDIVESKTKAAPETSRFGDVSDAGALIKAIEHTFDVAANSNLSTVRHPKNPNLQAKELLPVFPDYENWPNRYRLAVYDGDPIISSTVRNKGKLSEQSRIPYETALLKSQRVPNTQDQFVGYYAPTDDTAARILKRRQEDDEEEEDTDVYQFEHARDFDFKQQPAEKETPLLFIEIRSEEAAFYHKLGDKMILTRKRARKASGRDSGQLNVDRVHTYNVARRAFTDEEREKRSNKMEEVLPREEREKKGVDI